jgi:2-polyprenyl-3-methyl-5-hydroxy-6-metoxy-1,4-benzoquinol methylase
MIATALLRDNGPEDRAVKLLPDELKELWANVDERRFTTEQFMIEQDRRLDEFRDAWKRALLLKGRRSLENSLVWELGSYLNCSDLTEVERRAKRALETTRDEWQRSERLGDRQSIEQFYDESESSLYELMWWHTLSYDNSPLAYVNALQLAQDRGCHNCLEFGAGVGSGAILFARHGLDVTLADISSPMLRFCEWRFRLRGLPVRVIDLKHSELPKEGFDIITAMDVFEHLFDPVEAAERLWSALRPGGFLFARFGVEESQEDQPQHIVHDFGPTFQRMGKLGLVEVWQDEWLWGHQVFQKT